MHYCNTPETTLLLRQSLMELYYFYNIAALIIYNTIYLIIC